MRPEFLSKILKHGKYSQALTITSKSLVFPNAILFKEDPSVYGKHERLDAGDAYVLKKNCKKYI